MRTRATQATVDTMGRGDHACCICDEIEDGRAAAIRFIKVGLERNERCIYIVDESDPDAVLRRLANAGLNPARGMAADQLSILSYDNILLDGHHFSADRLLRLAERLTSAAQLDGYEGIRGVTEMSWALRGPPGVERLPEYEARLTPVLSRLPATILRIYDRSRFSDETLIEVIKRHPLILFEGEVLENPSYVPPDEYLGAVTATEALQRQLRRLKDAGRGRRRDRRILGVSPQIRQMHDVVDRVAPTNSSVLITGETGTGKELVAHAIHDRSLRRHHPLIKVNCAALPDDLLELELFGHERGAFTDAYERRLGRFELADRGTLMLDEVGAMSPKMQAKLLRALQEREVDRIGGTKPIKVDIRVVALTNQDLMAPERGSNFRNDLYYRLNVIPVELPPLRARLEDIPVLVDAFLARACDEIPRGIKEIDDDAMELLLQYQWPGNVRELENAIQRAVVLARNDTLHAEDFAFLHSGGPTAAILSLDELGAQHIEKVLRITGGNRTRAARALGIHRDTLYRKLRQHGTASAS